MAGQIKVLCCGDVGGRFADIFKRVEDVQKKSGQFDMMFCVGNFFGTSTEELSPYKMGQKKIPIPTYILGANSESHEGVFKQYEYEICPNLYYLGKRGLFTTSNGLRIAYLSGCAVEEGHTKKDYQFNVEDVEAVRDACFRGNVHARGVDILLTSMWPNGVDNGAPKQADVDSNYTSNLVSLLAMYVKPRYHISGLAGINYERVPFRTTNYGCTETELEIASRFIALGQVGNKKKIKYLYALKLTPLDKMPIGELLERTTDETMCPYLNLPLIIGNKRKNNTGNQYFYDMTSSQDQHQNKAGRNNKKQRKHVEFDQSKCWFCLASPTVEKHLVITIAEATYLAVAKGGLVDEHFLICPIEHIQSSILQSDTIRQEVSGFKKALTKYFESKNKVPVFFERNYKTSHMQIQVIPVPHKAAVNLKDIFMAEASDHGFDLQELESHNRLDQVVKGNTPYFMLELPSAEVLYTQINSKQDFPIHFGREVLASGPVLNLPDRIDWQNCQTSKDEEENLVKKIRNEFEPYDFTTEDDDF